MSSKSIATIATMGIDIGKNSFHVVGLDQRRDRPVAGPGRALLGGDESRTQLMWTPLCHMNNLPRLLFTSAGNTSNCDEQIKRASNAVCDEIKHAQIRTRR